MPNLDTLVSIAVDLTTALSTKERYLRLLDALRRVIPYDASALLRLEGGELVPVAARGLSRQAMGRRYPLSDHPRLDIICHSLEPVRFPADIPIPDPFDGLLECDRDASQPIHACLGCALHVGEKLVGALTADALDPHAFDALDPNFLKAVSALAGAQMRTADLIEAMERGAERHVQIADDLLRDIYMHRGSQILGSSRVMEHLRREIELVARSNFTVLVTGETGVGKELVVRTIHAASERRAAPMLSLNCAALPETLAESELFGHTRGAFTGAGRDRAGKFELADGGTLLLDEIGELPSSIQAKLLRTLQEGELQRVGSDKTVHVSVRLLAATNRDLEKEVREGRFRPDLFHRLNFYSITVPPLREHKEDIPILAGHFCELMQRRLGLGPVRISANALEVLSRYAWPGNVRELENVISRATLKASGELTRGESTVIQPIHLGGDFWSEAPPPWQSPVQSNGHHPRELSLREAIRQFQREAIRRALAKHHGNWAAAARELGVNRSNLHNLATRLGLREKSI